MCSTGARSGPKRGGFYCTVLQEDGRYSEYALFANRFQNQQFVDAHPAGSRVRVLYNPNNPDSSVLVRTIPLSQAWSPLLLVLCLGSGLFLAVAGLLLGRLWRWAGRRLVQSVSAGGN